VSGEPSQIASKILDWLKPTAHTMTIIFILCGLALFLPGCWLEKAHLNGFLGQYQPWLWVGFCFSGIYLATAPFFGENALHKKVAFRRKIKHRFQNVASDEKQALRRFLEHNFATVIMWPHESGVGSLAAAGILIRVSEDLGNGQFTYGLTPAALAHISKNRTEVNNAIGIAS
jgi:hypothetical protein